MFLLLVEFGFFCLDNFHLSSSKHSSLISEIPAYTAAASPPSSKSLVPLSEEGEKDPEGNLRLNLLSDANMIASEILVPDGSSLFKSPHGYLAATAIVMSLNIL